MQSSEFHLQDGFPLVFLRNDLSEANANIYGLLSHHDNMLMVARPCVSIKEGVYTPEEIDRGIGELISRLDQDFLFVSNGRCGWRRGEVFQAVDPEEAHRLKQGVAQLLCERFLYRPCQQ